MTAFVLQGHVCYSQVLKWEPDEIPWYFTVSVDVIVRFIALSWCRMYTKSTYFYWFVSVKWLLYKLQKYYKVVFLLYIAKLVSDGAKASCSSTVVFKCLQTVIIRVHGFMPFIKKIVTLVPYPGTENMAVLQYFCIFLPSVYWSSTVVYNGTSTIDV